MPALYSEGQNHCHHLFLFHITGHLRHGVTISQYHSNSPIVTIILPKKSTESTIFMVFKTHGWDDIQDEQTSSGTSITKYMHSEITRN